MVALGPRDQRVPEVARASLDEEPIDSRQTDPAAAFDQLDSAAALTPLATDPPLTAATIALSLGENERAGEEFAEALARDR